jgi:hypothetical protein
MAIEERSWFKAIDDQVRVAANNISLGAADWFAGIMTTLTSGGKLSKNVSDEVQHTQDAMAKPGGEVTDNATTGVMLGSAIGEIPALARMSYKALATIAVKNVGGVAAVEGAQEAATELLLADNGSRSPNKPVDPQGSSSAGSTKPRYTGPYAIF